MINMAYIDGGRIPGTKKTTIGGIILRDGIEVVSYSEVGGDGTNYDAEFQSVIRCIELAIEHGLNSLHIRTDAKVIADLLKTEYEVLNAMITDFEQDPSNKGLKNAISIRTREKFRDLLHMKAWLARNRTYLESKQACSPKYKEPLLTLAKKLDISFELIPREANTRADALCRKARKKIHSQ